MYVTTHMVNDQNSMNLIHSILAGVHSGPESGKRDKTIYSLNTYIIYMFIGFFWVKEFIFGVIFSLGAVMTALEVIKWWSRVVIALKDKVIACDMSIV